MVTARRVRASSRHATAAVERDGASVFQARTATASDLDTVNRVVVEAVKSWRLAERVHRLATPALTYDATDLAHMSLMLLADANGRGIGVAAWEQASRHQSPNDARAVLLHGLYVVPHYQHMGIGARLAGLVVQWAGERGFDGVMVRAWRDALPFFCAIGFEPLAEDDHAGQGPRRLWKPVQPSSLQRSAPWSPQAKPKVGAVRDYSR